MSLLVQAAASTVFITTIVSAVPGAETLMKFDAWTEDKGMSKEEALTNYVEVIVRHTVDNNREEVLLKFIKGAAAAS